MRDTSAHDADRLSPAAEVTPPPASGTVAPSPDRRVMDAWTTWLGALATNAEAAMAAAMAYRQLDASVREDWLSAVDLDASGLDIPRVALFAPLLAVETDPKRRLRIARAMGSDGAAPTPRLGAWGLLGTASDGSRVAVVATPLYLDFVQILACGYRRGGGFVWVRHEPIAQRETAPVPGTKLEGVVLESTSLKLLVDELAHVVVAHGRTGKPLPEALACFADLFDAVGCDGAVCGNSG